MFGWAKRIFLFMAVNLLVVLTVSVLLRVFHVEPYLTAYGLNYSSLAAFCLIYGMAGSFISLLLSRAMAKWMMGVRVIDPQTQHDPQLQALVQSVHNLSRAAGLPALPEVGVYDSPEVNAFATGPTKSRALVAVSTGLLSRLRRDEVEGVLGHEVSHIANGDMVTMTLIQGVANAFVMFLSRAVAFALAQVLRGDREERDGASLTGGVYWITQFALELVFMLLAMVVVNWFSRQREFRADRGGAQLAGRNSMIRALQALRTSVDVVDADVPQTVQALKISSRPSFAQLLSTHPPLEERIARLQAGV